MKGNGHNAIGGIKRLFNTVTVMNIYINIQYTVMLLEELEDGEYDSINITIS